MHNEGSTMSDCNVVPFSFLFRNLNWVLERDNGHFDQGLKSQSITINMIWHCLNMSCRFYTYYEWWPILNSNIQISTFADEAKRTHRFRIFFFLKNRLNFENDKLNFNGSCLDIQIKVFISWNFFCFVKSNLYMCWISKGVHHRWLTLAPYYDKQRHIKGMATSYKYGLRFLWHLQVMTAHWM